MLRLLPVVETKKQTFTPVVPKPHVPTVVLPTHIEHYEYYRSKLIDMHEAHPHEFGKELRKEVVVIEQPHVPSCMVPVAKTFEEHRRASVHMGWTCLRCTGCVRECVHELYQYSQVEPFQGKNCRMHAH